LGQAYNAVYKIAAGEWTSFALAAGHILSTLKPVRNMPQIEIVSFRYSRNVARENVDKITKKRTPMMITDPKTGQKKQAFFHQVVTHVYCVVGRSGAGVAAGAKMPDANTWGGNCRIVDCWLGSLGYECSFSVADYPKPGYLKAGLVSKVMGT
jgi:L,D-peptidoglycan transpeptidase YkuD (ErfK/YbiS/YcfS/YnhG family)